MERQTRKIQKNTQDFRHMDMVGVGDGRQYRKLDSKNDKVSVGGQTTA